MPSAVAERGLGLIAALYIDALGPYGRMAGVDPWPEWRDARDYNGPDPVVAHPPCGPWGKLKHQYEGSEHDCAPRALRQVRKFGGVLEHPADSMLWDRFKMPKPGEGRDKFGGLTIAIDQCAWGHVARKRTWLYLVRVDMDFVERTTRSGGEPTHWASGSRTAMRGAVPPWMKVCSAVQRRRTPPRLAQWLVDVAETARRK